MTSTLQVRPAVGHHRARRRRLIALAVAIAVLVVSNIMSNRILPEWAYVPWNLSMAFVLLGIAYRGGASPVAVGLGIRHWHRPVGVGLLLAGGTALLFALGMVLPATRNAFTDSRIGDADLWQMLWVVLVQIPLGTVLLEEVAFRGVLPALMGSSPAIRWRWIPVLGASVLFGLWHILPSIGIDNANAAVGGALGHNQALTTTLAVLSMTAAGTAMCALARVGKGIKTTMLLHWATNSLGFFAAWLLLH
ncbi:MAG TPA: CPBP family intramembrane glutamic endopeptidase [Nakamurella sp.]